MGDYFDESTTKIKSKLIIMVLSTKRMRDNTNTIIDNDAKLPSLKKKLKHKTQTRSLSVFFRPNAFINKNFQLSKERVECVIGNSI